MHYNHKRVYQIYRELELNSRIRPKQRLKQGKPETLAVPQGINEVWQSKIDGSGSIDRKLKNNTLMEGKSSSSEPLNRV